MIINTVSSVSFDFFIKTVFYLSVEMKSNDILVFLHIKRGENNQLGIKVAFMTCVSLIQGSPYVSAQGAH